MNALQAMPSGGALRLEITNEVATDNRFTVLRLIDTGTGIPQDVRPHIFESFFTGREDGTGLGLAIVKRILRAHRGDIVLESTSSAGTTFRLWIPTQT
jgi:signal transduction histidine kinase